MDRQLGGGLEGLLFSARSLGAGLAVTLTASLNMGRGLAEGSLQGKPRGYSRDRCRRRNQKQGPNGPLGEITCSPRQKNHVAFTAVECWEKEEAPNAAAHTPSDWATGR